MTSGAKFSAIWTCKRFDCDSGIWLRRTGRLGVLRSDLAASYLVSHANVAAVLVP